MARYPGSTACLTSAFSLGIVIHRNRIGGVAEVQEGGPAPSFHLGKPEGIVSTVLARKTPEVEKPRKARGEVLYNYSRDELIADHSTHFAHYRLDTEKGNDFCKHWFYLGRENPWQSRFLHSVQ
jgi:hypothetical protein